MKTHWTGKKCVKNINKTMKKHQGNHCFKATPQCDDCMQRGGVNNVICYSITNTIPKIIQHKTVHHNTF